MSKITLPLLPETYAWHYYNNGGGTVLHRGPSRRLEADMQAAREHPRVHHVVPLFTADQMQAYAREAVLAERERCAQLLESFGNAPDIQCFAAAIRNQGEPTA